MDENEMNGMEFEDLIVFEDDDGNEYTYTVKDYVFYNGDEYALLAADEEEADEDGSMECIVCRVVPVTDEDGEEAEDFELVEDEDLAEKLVEIFNTRLAEDDAEE